MTEIILYVDETLRRHGRFDGWIGDQQIVWSARTPFFTAARNLLKQDHDPSEILIMCHKKTGTDSLRGPIGKAAKLTVTENQHIGPKFARYDPAKVDDLIAD